MRIILVALTVLLLAPSASAWTKYSAHKGKPTYIECSRSWPKYARINPGVNRGIFMRLCETGSVPLWRQKR